MRVVGRRTKKLIAAFHFQFANQAGWECGECRRNGLEKKRRCAWMSGAAAAERVVWARKGVSTRVCPRSYISAQSLGWVEQFWVRRKLGCEDLRKLPARDVEAFLILGQQWDAERGDAV